MKTKKNIRITGDTSNMKKMKTALKESEKIKKGKKSSAKGISVREALNEIIIML